jgi:hypothetical protein
LLITGIDIETIGSNTAIKLLAVKLTQLSISSISLNSSQLDIVIEGLQLLRISLSKISQEINKDTIFVSDSEIVLLDETLSKLTASKSIIEAFLSSASSNNTLLSAEETVELIATLSNMSSALEASGKSQMYFKIIIVQLIFRYKNYKLPIPSLSLIVSLFRLVPSVALFYESKIP